MGVIEAEQQEDGETIRNDRLITVAAAAHNYAEIRAASDISPNLLHELEQFFISFNQTQGKSFRLLETKGSLAAGKVLKAASRPRRKRRAK